MGISGARIWMLPDSDQRSRALRTFWFQLVLNFLWTLVFFNAQAYGIASFWILALSTAVAWMIFRFWKLDRLAGILQVPYLIWLILATYLTFGVWYLNG
jgi:tryptophan-rich sensory protein